MLGFLSHEDTYLELFGPDFAAMQVQHGGTEYEVLPSGWKAQFFPDQPLDAYTIEEGFRILERYSLVQWQGHRGSYWMHHLVYAWCYD